MSLIPGQTCVIDGRMPRIQRNHLSFFILICTAALSIATAAARQPANPTQEGQSPRLDELQIMLDQAGFSVGQIDAKPGRNTDLAVAAFQQSRGLTPTGNPDAATLVQLRNVGGGHPWTYYTISDEDTTGPFLTDFPSTMEEKAKYSYLGYTSVYAKLGEKFHTNATLLRGFNPGVKFLSGQRIVVPNVVPMEVSRVGKAISGGAWTELTIVASRGASTLQLLDRENRILFHAPITTGGKKDPLPLGTYKVEGVDRHPVYHYDPKLFWDAGTSDTKVTVPPGPNNPVGLVWINLNKEHVGIHGTPSPGRIGYAVSHGCVRLTNWDVMRLAAMIGSGTNVIFKE